MHTATFITDIPTLFLLGFAVAAMLTMSARRQLTGEQYAELQQRVNRTVFAVTVLFIVLVEIPTFLDVPYAIWLMRSIPAADGMTGNEFMWHGYFRWPGRVLCEAFAASPDDSSCAKFDPPIGDPGNYHWWPVMAACFFLQWLAAKIGQRVAGVVTLFRGGSDPPDAC
jgi:hypothetical protein